MAKPQSSANALTVAPAPQHHYPALDRAIARLLARVERLPLRAGALPLWQTIAVGSAERLRAPLGRRAAEIHALRLYMALDELRSGRQHG